MDAETIEQEAQQQAGGTPAAAPPPAAQATPQTPPATPATSAPSQSLFELPQGVDPATVKLPEGSKYATLGEAMKAQNEAISARDRAAAELQQLKERVGEYSGAPVDETGNPVDYQVAVPEQYKDVLDTSDPMFNVFTDVARELGVSQQQFDGMVARGLLPWATEMFKANTNKEQAALAEHYGGPAQRDAVNGQITSWVQTLTNNDPEAMQEMQQLGILGGRVATLFLERLHRAATQPNIAPQIKGDSTQPNVGQVRHDPATIRDPRGAGQLERAVQASIPKQAQGPGAPTVVIGGDRTQ